MVVIFYDICDRIEKTCLFTQKAEIHACKRSIMTCWLKFFNVKLVYKRGWLGPKRSRLT